MAQGFKRAKSPAASSSSSSSSAGNKNNNKKQRLTKGAIQIKPKKQTALQATQLQRQFTAEHTRQTEEAMQARLRGQAGAGIKMKKTQKQRQEMQSIEQALDPRALEAGLRAQAKRQQGGKAPRKQRQ